MKKPTLSLSKLCIAVLMAVSCHVHAITPSDVSASQKSNKAKYTLDDDLSTRWSVKGQNGNQWIQYDFASATSFTAIEIAFHKGNKRNQHFHIQSSEDGENWIIELEAVSNGETRNLETFIFDDIVTASHLRIVGFGNSKNKWNVISEVSFVGSSNEEQPVDEDDPIDTEQPSDDQPIENEISTTASSSSDDGNDASNTLDNDLNTRWSAQGDGQWLTFDMGSTHTVEALQIAFYKGDQRDANLDIQISSDNSSWSTIWSGTQPSLTLEKMIFDVAQASGQYVRILGHGNSENSWNSITEVDVIGTSGGTNFPPVDDDDPVDEEQPIETDPENETDPGDTVPGYVAPIIDESRVPTTSNVITVGSGKDYASIQAAINAIKDVDTTILISAGTYSEKIEMDTCGSSAGYIVIQGEEGAVMSGSSGDAFYLENCSYVKIRGLEITGYDQGIEVAENSDSIYIENNYLHHIGDSSNSLVVYVHGGDTIDPNENIFVLNNEMSYNTTGNSEVLTINGNVDGFLIQGNHVHHNNNIGIDVIGFEGNGPDGYDQARNGIISDNIVEFISTEGGDGFDRNPTYDKNDYSADGIYVDGGKNIIIERNIVRDCDLGIELASEHSGENTENIIVRNNFVANSYQGNITMGGWKSSKGNAVNIEIYNNTTYNGNDAEILVQHNSSNVTIKNNIFYAKSGGEYLYMDGKNNDNFTVSNNIYFGSSNDDTGSWTDSNALFVDPQLFNVSSSDLHIADSSPAVDAGTSIPDGGDFDIDGEARINGSVDIGADER